MRRIFAAALLGSIALLAGCSTGASGPADPPGSLGTDPLTADSATSGQPGESATTPTRDTDQAERDVIRTATITMSVEDPLAAADRLSPLATSNGGYLESVTSGAPPCDPDTYCAPAQEGTTRSTVAPGSTSASESVVVVIRVPADRYDAAVDDVRGLGEVLDLSVSTQDVTGATADLAARIDAQRASVARVRELMARAGSLSEVVQVEKELADRQSELESLVAERDQLAKSVAMATITANLLDPAAAESIESTQSHWWDAPWAAFIGSWQVLLIALAGLSPLFIALGVAALVATAILRRRRSRRREDAEQEARTSDVAT